MEKRFFFCFHRRWVCGLPLDQYGMIEHVLLKGHREHLQKITSLCCQLRWTQHTGHTMKDLINSISIQHEAVWREKPTRIFPNIVYKCSFTFKGGYDIDMNNLHWYKFCFIDINLRSILLYVYFCSWSRNCVAHLKMWCIIRKYRLLMDNHQ